jgi:hypothetical protein
MKRTIYANGAIHLTIFDATDEDYQDRHVDLCTDSCPCGGTVTEEDDHCKECGAYIIWENSKTWSRIYQRVTKKRIEETERMYASSLEETALGLLYAASIGKRLNQIPDNLLPVFWPEGTVNNLRELRKIPDVSGIPMNWLAKTSKLAMNRTNGKFGSWSANWFLTAILSRFNKATKTKGRYVRPRTTKNTPRVKKKI